MKKLLLLLMLLSTTMLNAQDVIVKNDGSTIICKVIEVGTSEVKYKKYSNLDGPLYSILLTDVQNINFENGEREKFSESLTTESPKDSGKKDLVLNYGTEFPIQIASPVRAKDVSEGQNISFKSMIDITVDGVKVIPAGTPVYGIVYKAKRSSWFGTKGKLGIRLDHLLLPDGNRVPVEGDIYVTGKNRTALSVLLFLFVTWPACFICGSKAELPYGFDTMAKIGTTVYFSKDGKSKISNSNPVQLPKKEPLRLSSLDSIPDLPCNATLYYLDGKQEKVQIVKIKQEKGVMSCKKITVKKKGNTEKIKYGEPYTVKEAKLYKIEFEDTAESDNEDNQKEKD